MASVKIAVIGGGIVGTTVAHGLASRNAAVTLYESNSELGAGVSRIALGGITPFSDDHIRTSLLCFSQYTANNYSAWLNQLSQSASSPVAELDGGLLYVYFDHSNRDKIASIGEAYPDDVGVLEHLSAQQLQNVEPRVSRHALGAFWLRRETVVDPTLVMKALTEALSRSPQAAIKTSCFVNSVECNPYHVTLRWTERDAETASSDEFDFVVFTQGLGLRKLIPRFAKVLVGVKGEAIEFRARADGLPITRFHVYGKLPPSIFGVARDGCPHPAEVSGSTPNSYIVPRSDGRVFAGVTYLEGDESTGLSLRSAHQIVSATRHLWPSSEKWELLKTWSGVRPSTQDHLPIIGAFEADKRLIAATCHYGVGMTLAPATAEVVADLVGLNSALKMDELTKRRLSPNRWD